MYERSNSDEKTNRAQNQARSASPAMNVQDEFQMIKDKAIKLPKGEELQKSMHVIYDGEPKSWNNLLTPGLIKQDISHQIYKTLHDEKMDMKLPKIIEKSGS